MIITDQRGDRQELGENADPCRYEALTKERESLTGCVSSFINPRCTFPPPPFSIYAIRRNTLYSVQEIIVLVWLALLAYANLVITAVTSHSILLGTVLAVSVCSVIKNFFNIYSFFN